MYKAKNIGDKIPPCRTPARIGNQQEYVLPHQTYAKHFPNKLDNKPINFLGNERSMSTFNNSGQLYQMP